jgi:hypothetical protein
MEMLTLFASNKDEAAAQVAQLEQAGDLPILIDTIWGTHLGRVFEVKVRLADPSETREAFQETGIHCPFALDVMVCSPTVH